MKKSTIQKTVDEANAKALASYEASVASVVNTIKQAQANIANEETHFATYVAGQGVYIAQQRDALAKLTPPAKVTAEEIFGTEIVANATE